MKGHVEKPASISCLGALLLFPIILVVRRHGLMGITAFLPSDEYYYLTVARQSSLFFFTFDGVHACSGFHPLWQWCLTVTSLLVHRDPEQLLLFAFLINVTLVLAGITLTALAVTKLTKIPSSAIILVPGLYTIIVRDQAMGEIVGSAWSRRNGMETSLTVFFGGTLLYLLSQNKNRRLGPTRGRPHRIGRRGPLCFETR